MNVWFKAPSCAGLEEELKGFWDHPPNAKGKSSFHWLILNVISLCIIVDLREDIFLQTVGEDIDAHKLTLHWSSQRRKAYILQFDSSVNMHSSEKKIMNILYQGLKVPTYSFAI